MGVEIIHHQHKFLALWIMHIDQFTDEMGPILADPMLGNFHLSPPRQRFTGKIQLAHSCGFKQVIKAFRLSWLHRLTLLFLSEKLFGTFVHADLWKTRIVGTSIHLQYIFQTEKHELLS